MLVAGLALAAAVLLAGAKPAYAAGRWSDGSGQTMYYAKTLTSGKGVIGEFETDRTGSEGHWYKFKTSGRRSVYTVKLIAMDGGTTTVNLYNADGDCFKQNETTNTCTYASSTLDKNSWYYFEVFGTRYFRNVCAEKYDEFKITVTEQPILKKVSTPTASAARNSAKVSWRTQANATHYRVYYRAKTGSGWGAWRQRTFTAKVKSCTLTGLKSKTYYQVCVRAYRKGGWNWDKDTKSDWSDLSNARTIKTK